MQFRRSPSTSIGGAITILACVEAEPFGSKSTLTQRTSPTKQRKYKEPRSPVPRGYERRQHDEDLVSRAQYSIGKLRSRLRKIERPRLLLVLLVLSTYIYLASGTKRGSSGSSRSASPASHAVGDHQSHSVRRHANGLAYFDIASLGEHPIITLTRNASLAWDEKVARQSKTLVEAVEEYRRRYKRHPPKGFDEWYHFAEANNVVLIDEYDNIDRDIRPFFALDSSYLRELVSLYANFNGVDTIALKDGRVEVHAAHDQETPRPRTLAQKALIEDCCGLWLQEANITLTPDDGPAVAMGAEHRQVHLDAVEKGNLLSRYEAETVVYESNHGSDWWSAVCSEGSRYRRSVMGLEAGALPAGLSFVYDHSLAMDLCQNPETQQLHGFTAWSGRDPIKLWPVFAHSAASTSSDIRIAPLEQYQSRYDSKDPEWEHKPYHVAGWRGSTTGVRYQQGTPWHGTQRIRMSWLANNATGKREVYMPAGASGFEHVELDLAILGKTYLDFKFVGDVVQCVEADGSCDRVRRVTAFAPYMSDEQLLKYKYLLDIDGNAWSGRFHRLMSSNSLVLKSTIFPEWYSDRIQPWLHYVPVKLDYSDVFDIMAFFSGDLSGRGHHDHLAKSIAYAGKDWAAKHWRLEDMQAYNARLYLEWARLTAPDRASMDYVL